MRELQPDDLNVESLRGLGISDREMRFVQVHATSLHPLQVRAQFLHNRHYSRAYSSCGPDHRNRERSDFLRHQVTASHYLFAGFGAIEASFSKRGSFRSGSNIGSNWSSAGVSGTFEASGPAYGIESNFCKAAIARSGSPVRAPTRARISIGPGPSSASFSIGTTAMARSNRVNAVALSPRPVLVSARSPMRLE